MANKIDAIRPVDETLLRGEIIKQSPSAKSSNPTSYHSIGAMSDEQIVDAHIGQPDIVRGMGLGIVNEDQLPAHMRSIVDDTERGIREGRKPRSNVTQMTMSGTPDPMLAKSGITIGCTVYHKDRLLGGKVCDISVRRGVEVKLKSGKKVWWNPKHLRVM
jgi:hypothetical protein